MFSRPLAFSTIPKACGFEAATRFPSIRDGDGFPLAKHVPGFSQKPLSIPVSTYSIVARDQATGEIGVAVQSRRFSVGSVVPWPQAGIGAVATQSFDDPTYGPLGLELMRAGRSAPAALNALVSTDEEKAVRQVAMIDAEGRVAAHTGSRAIRTMMECPINGSGR